MNKQQSGFTLIELIMVIVVLGALAVTALPKYVDLQTQAELAGTEGVAGALAAGSAINFAAEVAGAASVTQANCSDVPLTILGGTSGVPAAGYTVTALAFTNAGLGGVNACDAVMTGGPTVSFNAIAVP